MKYWEVELKTIAIIEAENARQAGVIAREKETEICSDHEMDIEVTDEIRFVSELSDGWNGVCIPYGGDGNTSLDKLLKKQ